MVHGSKVLERMRNEAIHLIHLPLFQHWQEIPLVQPPPPSAPHLIGRYDIDDGSLKPRGAI